MEGCIFCHADFQSRAIDRSENALVVVDLYPVTPGHLLFVPIDHYCDYFETPESVRREIDSLIFSHRQRILKEDPTVTGFNIGMNCGESAGQTILHAHVHLIPRREGDTSEPRGGIRGCIPEQMSY